MERDLKADLKLCEKATPGPWKANEVSLLNAYYVKDSQHGTIAQLFSSPDRLDNLMFFIGARQGWHIAIQRALSAEAENAELRAEVGRLKKDLSDAVEHIGILEDVLRGHPGE